MHFAKRALLLFFCLADCLSSAATLPAGTILLHGRIFTASSAHPWAEAVAIQNGTILAVGTDDAISKYRGHDTKVIDLGGRMAMPGLIDTHTHFLWGSYGLAGVSLYGLRTVAEVKTALHRYAVKHPEEQWVYGAGWPYGPMWPTGLPTKDILDAVFPDRTVALLSEDGHSLWVNSHALAAAKITKATPDPTGAARGIIVRDRNGEPTGILEEGAKRLVLNTMNVPLSEQLDRLRTGMAFANQHGITGVVNGTGDLHEMELYQQLESKGQLTVRVTTAFAEDVGVRHTLSLEELNSFEEGRRRFHDDWVRAGLVKFFADGVIETHTAAMLAPYANKPHNQGQTLYTAAEFKKDFLALDRRGFQVMTHAIGDAAVRTVLDAYEYVAQTDGPRDRRWRIEHMETVAPADQPRLAKLSVIAAIQPWCCPEQDPPWPASIGNDRLAEGLPWQAIVGPGATLIMGSDWPVESLDPFPIIQMGLTRQPAHGPPGTPFFPKQALTLDQMLLGYTRHAAYGEFMEKRLGTLEPGKLADLVVLSQDLYKIPPSRIKDTKVVLTVVNGKPVYRNGL